MLSFAKLMRQRYNTAQSADLAVRKLQSPFDKLPQRRFIAMSTFTAFQMQHTCGLQAERYSFARYHRSTFSVSCLRAESQQQLRQRKHTYGSSEYKVAVNSQQASPQTSLVRRHLLSSAALVGLLSSTPIAWAQEQLDAPEPVQAAKDLIADLLEKSKANKVKNDKDRLESYYRRNYKDWFDIEKGNFGIGSQKNQLSKELQQEILQWIEKNKSS